MKHLVRKTPLLLILVITLLAFSGCKVVGLPDVNPPGQEPGEPGGENVSKQGALVGTVYDRTYNNLKLESGQVEIDGRKFPIKNGTYKVDNLASGTYTLLIKQAWYNPIEIEVYINGNTVYDIAMTPRISPAELDLFARIVSSEARGESFLGQVAVAATVLNRVLDHRFPNSITGVVYEVTVANGIRYYQYEPVKNGTINQPATQSAKDASRRALAGWDPTMGATGFYAPDKVPQWSNGRRPWVWEQWDNDPIKLKIGNHNFFR